MHALLAAVVAQVSGVTCTIIIKRYTAQWILSAILPIVASTWLGFVVFLLPRCVMLLTQSTSWEYLGANMSFSSCVAYMRRILLMSAASATATPVV
jgi:hypothetical protein